MNITIQKLKEVILKKNYKWFENQINLIGIRTKLQVPDVFNDLLFLVYKNEKGEEVMFTTTYTTEPGVYYQKHLLNPKGCWVMMPNQMIDAYKLGLHQGKADHKCLKSVGKIYGLREDDKDGIVLNDKDAIASWVEGNTVGANFHGAKKLIDLTEIVGQNSAGCQVINRWSKKEEVCAIAKLYEKVNNGLITYTLLTEQDFI